MIGSEHDHGPANLLIDERHFRVVRGPELSVLYVVGIPVGRTLTIINLLAVRRLAGQLKLNEFSKRTERCPPMMMRSKLR